MDQGRSEQKKVKKFETVDHRPPPADLLSSFVFVVVSLFSPSHFGFWVRFAAGQVMLLENMDEDGGTTNDLVTMFVSHK
jgi:hypothetical protein